MPGIRGAGTQLIGESFAYSHVFRVKHALLWPEGAHPRFGHPCRILVRGRGNICVEFGDGYKLITTRWGHPAKVERARRLLEIANRPRGGYSCSRLGTHLPRIGSLP